MPDQTLRVKVSQFGDAVGPFNVYYDNFNNLVEGYVTLERLASASGITITVPSAANIIVL